MRLRWPWQRATPRIVQRTDGSIELQFARGIGQTRVSLRQPDRLLIGYTRTMLGALVLRPDPERIGILGLGGGAQAHFCHRHLPNATIEAAEVDADVIAMRDRFGLPRDARLRIEHIDAMRFLQSRPDHFDLILLDCYDADGLPASVATDAFHRVMHAALREGAAIAWNLYGVDVAAHVRTLSAAFGDCVFSLRDGDNTVAIAWKGGRGAVQASGPMQAGARLTPEGQAQLQDVFDRVNEALRAHMAQMPLDAGRANAGAAHEGRPAT